MNRLEFKFLAFFLAASFLAPPLSAQGAFDVPQEKKFDSAAVLSRLRFDTSKDLEASRRLLLDALAFDPGNADYHFELSRVYGAIYDQSAQGRKSGEDRYLSMSEKELGQVLMIRPNDVPAHYNLGVIYKRRKEMERAREEFRRVLKLSEKADSASPVTVSAWLQIGSVYEEQGFFEDAREAYTKARQLGGDRPEIQSAMEDLKVHQDEELGRKHEFGRADAWTRQYVSGADYARYGSDALRAQSQSAGMGALLPIVGQMLFEQFMQRREAAKHAKDQAAEDESEVHV